MSINIIVIIAFTILAIIIFYFLSRKPSQSPQEEGLSKAEIDKINKGIQDTSSEYYESMPNGKSIRYETVIDLILMNLNSENKRILLDNPINLDSAIQMLAYAAEKEPNDTEFRQQQITRIENERSFVFPELGKDKCPPPPPPQQLKDEKSEIEALKSADYWVWTLNRIYNHLLDHDTKVDGLLDKQIPIEPTIENKYYTQFDKPSEVTGKISEFKWTIKLTNIKTGKTTTFNHIVFFQN